MPLLQSRSQGTANILCLGSEAVQTWRVHVLQVGLWIFVENFPAASDPPAEQVRNSSILPNATLCRAACTVKLALNSMPWGAVLLQQEPSESSTSLSVFGQR